jgi:hypothetical protein
MSIIKIIPQNYAKQGADVNALIKSFNKNFIAV